jgi:hypothetical protein
MKTAAQYREHAAQCRDLASYMDRPEHRRQLLQMAETWESMAEQREAMLAATQASDASGE